MKNFVGIVVFFIVFVTSWYFMGPAVSQQIFPNIPQPILAAIFPIGYALGVACYILADIISTALKGIIA